THFDLTDLSKYPDRELGCPEVVARGLKRMITVPVFDPGQHNHVRLLVSLFPRIEELRITDEELLWFGMDVARAANAALDILCESAAISTNLLTGRSRNVRGYLEQLVGLIQKVVGCEGLTIFLLNDVRDRLEATQTTGIEWLVPENERF